MNHTKRILIADDDPDLVDGLSRRCTQLGLEVHAEHDGINALTLAHQVNPDVVLLDVNMPSGSGLSVCEMLAGEEKLRATPVVIMTGSQQEEIIRRCHDLMAYYLPKGSDLWSRLKPLLCEILAMESSECANRLADATTDDVHPDSTSKNSSTMEPRACRSQERTHNLDAFFNALGWDEEYPEEPPTSHQAEQTTRPWLLCVDDDGEFSLSLKMRLGRHGVEVLRAFAGMEGYRYAFTRPAHAIILDYEMPDGNGDYILRRLKENPVTRDIPVIVLTGYRDRMLERKMYNLGAVRFFNKPVAWNDLWRELQLHLELEIVGVT